MSLEEVAEVLRYVKHEAETHTYISPWLVIEHMEDALEKLAAAVKEDQ